MGTRSTLLCIHRDPAQLSLLRESGCELVTATNGYDGLHLFISRPVDAIVLDYHVGPLYGRAVADEIKKVEPRVPIVMLAEDIEPPDEALKFVDALVTKSDGPHFLLATVRFVLRVRSAQRRVEKEKAHNPSDLRRIGRSRERVGHWLAVTPQIAANGNDDPFTPRVWRSIRNGTFRF